MKPIVAIVGRPNVGKSTLFNRIVGEKRAIVLDTPGVTRDRNYGDAAWRGAEFTVIDTGGFEPRAEIGVQSHMRDHAMLAIEEADVVVFVLDGRAGLLPDDEDVVLLLRRCERAVIFAVNKVDGPGQDGLAAEFFAIGAECIVPISAEHGRGVGRLLDAVVDALPPATPTEEAAEGVTQVALVGRPNAGKSTLANYLLGEERMIVDAVPGTTRDAIDSVLEVDGRTYNLIDTAGLRRSRSIDRRSPEGYSVVRTLRALERCHVAVTLIDAVEGITEQDQRIIGLADEKGRALIIGVNKWDAVSKDARTAQVFQEQLRLKLPFAEYAPVLFLSGLTGQRVHRLLGLVDQVRAAHQLRVATGPLNRWLETTTAAHQPPVVRGRRLRFYYATQVAVAPPTVMISCNEPEGLHFSYRRYLVNQFRTAFSVEGTPIRLIFRGKKDRHAEPD